MLDSKRRPRPPAGYAHHPNTPKASMTPKPPSAKQLPYLRAHANRAGQTFTYPATSRQASAEIRRLKATAPSTPAELAIECDDHTSEHAARQRGALVPIGEDETCAS
jgi:hypothetical protein